MARYSRAAAQSLRHRRDQEASADVPASLLQAEPVQAHRRSECAKGRLGWLAVAARGLACAERWRCDRMAERAGNDSGTLGARADKRQAQWAGIARAVAAAAQFASCGVAENHWQLISPRGKNLRGPETI